MGIPKIINQMWLHGDKRTSPSQELIDCTNILKRDNPYVEYRWWNNESVRQLFDDDEDLSKYESFFHTMNPIIAKCDFARYMIMYHTGGIYLDIDITTKGSIPEELWDRDILLYFEENRLKPEERFECHNWEISHKILVGIIGSRPRNPFWLVLLDRIVDKYNMMSPLVYMEDIFSTTGPGMMSNHMIHMIKYCGDQLEEDYSPLPWSNVLDLFIINNELGKTWQLPLIIDQWSYDICVYLLISIIIFLLLLLFDKTRYLHRIESDILI